MSAPRPSEADVEAVVEVIVGHQRIPTYRGNSQRCTGCDHLRDETDGPNSPRHARHVAEQILASDWLAARDAEHGREVAALRRSKSALVEQTKRLQDQIARASMEPGQDRQKAVHAYAARAVAAERALADLREQIETLDRSGRMSFDHSDLRALLPRDDAAGAGGAG